MKDTVIKGAGNSRLLKSVPNALTLYPTYESFVQALATSGLPIDLLGLQAAGVEQMGTNLNKANLLSDATETAIWGNTANRTPNQALSELAKLNTEAKQLGLNNRVSVLFTQSGSWTAPNNIIGNRAIVVCVGGGGGGGYCSVGGAGGPSSLDNNGSGSGGGGGGYCDDGLPGYAGGGGGGGFFGIAGRGGTGGGGGSHSGSTGSVGQNGCVLILYLKEI